MNSKYFSICRLLEYTNPDIEKGDTILVGRWKNSPAIVKGFGKDKNRQPTVKTNKGSYSLYRFRLKKLMKESYNPSDDVYFTNLLKKIATVIIPENVYNDIKDCISRSSNRIAKRHIATIDGADIYLVNGKEVKEKFDMDFTEGSNGAAKKYVPQNEVWLDSHYDMCLLRTILFHEMSERYLMSVKGFDYDTAHDFSNKVEKYAMKSNE